ncbi:TadE/TadG family type IV pilus assembly protein [Ammoniphilus sp. CFH 90114]|uniref:TadE/TadG family type IV pilus assembly protein n=1 Tax=Ammoniphilus sp. CFH 90114 TaxID=2493665 RepID=UPI0013E9070A|nr:TadE/TadG family type IV pilus assembly protein [Ammoniphilus sp. CFH 90114]
MRSNKGQSTVELALCLPILLILLIGILDFGLVLHTNLMLDHAGREAARAASVGKTDAEVSQMILSGTPGLQSSKLSFSVTPAQANRTRGVYATVTISYPIDFISPITKTVFQSPYTITTKTVMRVE